MVWRIPKSFKGNPSLEERIDKLLQSLNSSEACYAHLLHLCTHATSLSHGKRVHSHLVASGLGGNQNLQDLLIRLYGKCGDLENARSIFDSLQKRSLLAWKSLITAYAHKGHSRDALELYQRMKDDGVEADVDLFARVLGACGCLRDLAHGEALHSEILARRLESSTLVTTALVSMYGKSGDVETARSLFDGVHEKDIVCWNAMIAAYSRSEHPHEALHLYKAMIEEARVEANAVTYTCVLGACSALQALEEGQALHLRFMNSSLRSAVLVVNALISFYSSCRRLDDAVEVFKQAETRNVISWNSVISACVQLGSYTRALDIYEMMDLQPDGITYTTALSACSSIQELRVGKSIHSRIVATGLKPDKHLQLALLNMHAKCGELQLARELFDRLDVKDIGAWNVLIVAHAEQGFAWEVLQFYRRLKLEGLQPNELTIASVVSACSSLEMVKLAEKIVNEFICVGNVVSLRVENALLSVYARCGKLEGAENMFNRIQRRDVVSWTGMISGYAQLDEPEKALSFFRRMCCEGIEPNEATLATVIGACSSKGHLLQDGVRIHESLELSRGSISLRIGVILETALLNMYNKCGRNDCAQEVFNSMQHRDVVAWNVMLTANANQGDLESSLELYNRMVSEGVRPDANTFTSLLVACTGLSALAEGKDVHSKIVRSGFESSVIIVTALINMYAKCGRVDLAKDVFDASRRRSRCGGSSAVWNSMVSALAHHGHGVEASSFFEEMTSEGVEADETSAMCFLVACSHAGLESRAWLAFVNMFADHRVKPEVDHYVSMVDLLGRCGKLEECEELIRTMPFEPHEVAWISLLSACRDNGDLARAQRAEQEILRLCSVQHNNLMIDAIINSKLAAV